MLVERSRTSFGVTVQSPRDARRRGSHVAFGYKNGLQVHACLGGPRDHRRFPHPRHDALRRGAAIHRLRDVVRVVEALHDILRTGSWDSAEFRGTTVVT